VYDLFLWRLDVFVTLSSKRTFCPKRLPTSKDPKKKVLNILHKLRAPSEKHQGARIK